MLKTAYSVGFTALYRNKPSATMASFQQDWWLTEYSQDIIENMRRKEQSMPVYYAQSPQLEHRRGLVDWLAQVAEEFKLQNTTLHLAIHFLDYFMDNHDIEVRRLRLLALGTLLIAAKFEEKDSRVPEISQLNYYLPEACPLKFFLHIEIKVLKFFDWNLMIPTAAHFIDSFTYEALSLIDFEDNQPLSKHANIKTCIKKYIAYFLDVSQQSHLYIRFPRSLVAAACIASSFITLRISPVWPEPLRKLTLYTLDNLQPCIDLMIRTLEDEKNASKETLEQQNSSEEDSSYKGSITDSPQSVSSVD